VGGVHELGFEGFGDDPLYVGIGDGAGRDGPRVIDEAVEAFGDEAVPPDANGGVADMQFGPTTVLLGSSAQAKTMRARRASHWELLGLGPRGEILAFVLG